MIDKNDFDFKSKEIKEDNLVKRNSEELNTSINKSGFLHNNEINILLRSSS